MLLVKIIRALHKAFHNNNIRRIMALDLTIRSQASRASSTGVSLAEVASETRTLTDKIFQLVKTGKSLHKHQTIFTTRVHPRNNWKMGVRQSLKDFIPIAEQMLNLLPLKS